MTSSEEGRGQSGDAAAGSLGASQSQIAAILAGVGVGITVQDTSGRLVYANDAAARLSGFPTAEAMLAAPVSEILSRFEVFTEDGGPFPLSHLPGRRVLLGEDAAEALVQFRVIATGEVHWSLVSATPVRDEGGRVQFAVNSFRDITERKRAEDVARFLAAAGMELTRSLDYEATLQRVAALAVPTLADWCVVDILDEEGHLRRLAAAHVDPAKVQLARELTERYPVNLDAPAGVPQVLRTGKPSIEPEVTDAQLVAAARDPEHLSILRSLHIRSGLSVPLIARGHTFGAISLVQAESGRRYDPRDLTVAEDLAARAALAIDNARLYREAQRQLEVHVQLNTTLQETMDQLQNTLRTRDSFLASASHDLKNPLASIKGLAQLFQLRLTRPGGLTPDEVRDVLARIGSVATRAAEQVEELLDVAGYQLGRPLSLDRRPTDLVALVREVVAEYQEQSERHQIHIETAVPELTGSWDGRRLARVIGNLLNNSVKYSPDGGEIRVRVSRQEGQDTSVVVTVSDHGVGIPPDDLGRIFDRFQRGVNVDGHFPGTGIGLTSARQLIEGHGGSITATSEPGRGATFTIRLPLEGPAEGSPGKE